MKNVNKEALELHKKFRGKIEVVSKVPLKTMRDLSVYYTPGVAEPCKEIARDKNKVYDYTSKGNMVAVVTDGSRVLGLGNIGPEAGLPVYEGKAILFKEFGGVDAFPICLDTQDTEEIIKAVKQIAPVFGGINLEDIDAPKCFEIEERLKKELDIPVFHDDQHGTAIAVLAGLINALKIVGKKLPTVRITVSGAGAAGIAITKLLLNAGAKNIIVCDTKGILYEGRDVGMNRWKDEIARMTNREKLKGELADAMKGADVFVGVSAPGIVSEEMISNMSKDAIVFALSNPKPEIDPEMAKKAGARIVATGRSDFPNQVNNVLVFPGIFRGVLDARAKEISEEMKLAAAYALAELVPKNKLSEDFILPNPLDKNVGKAVASAVTDIARKLTP